MERLTITIRPSPSEESLLRVEDAMAQVLDLIRFHKAAEQGVGAATPGQAFEWRLEQASTESPFTVVAIAEPVDPTADVTKSVQMVKLAVRGGLRALMRGDTPSWMGPEAFSVARSLFSRTQNGVSATRIEYGPKEVVSIDRAQAETALKAISAISALALDAEIPDRWAQGEIQGLMVAVGWYAGRNAIQIRTSQYGPVWCPISEEQSKQWGGEHRIREVWEGKVLGVSGRLFYRSGKLSRIEVDDIREIGPARPIDLDAIVDPGFTAGLDPAEYLRQLHEGELG